MVEAAIGVIGPFDQDIPERMYGKPITAMVIAVCTAMKAVADGADVKSGIQAGLALRSSQEVIWPNQQRLDPGQ
jgi:hypothetical protein